MALITTVVVSCCIPIEVQFRGGSPSGCCQNTVEETIKGHLSLARGVWVGMHNFTHANISCKNQSVSRDASI